MIETQPICSNQLQAANCVAVVNAVQRVHCVVLAHTAAGTLVATHEVSLYKHVPRVPEHQ